MKRLALVASMVMVPGASLASDVCDDLWFTRNLILDRNGYCFESPLGQAVFDNEGCTEAEPVLGGDDQYLIAYATWREEELGCAVDTARTTLDVSQIELRRKVAELPLGTGTERACIGWRGGRVSLRAARDDISPLLGAIRTGDTILFRFDRIRGWSFVEVVQNGVGAGAGWAQITLLDESCEAVVG
ncbi:DUF4453 domain-containing protein [Anianabacter salinae]|uniref:DUF4453 domain-containing protein n=1 Tax=Anianabacter salinae TaxID=2851023 RepID=UPI00225E53BE|nr:DUF4453 domain-containing protein [Anianabacter salinae]MBV0910805.1 DUF4453 domain-containing protein [Anianabacter salinae]